MRNLFIYLFIIILLLLFILPFIYSFFRSFIISFIFSFILSSIRSFIISFIHSFFHPFVHSIIHLFVHPFVHSFVHSFIQSFVYSILFRFYSSSRSGFVFLATFLFIIFNSYVNTSFSIPRAPFSFFLSGVVRFCLLCARLFSLLRTSLLVWWRLFVCVRILIAVVIRFYAFSPEDGRLARKLGSFEIKLRLKIQKVLSIPI